jgi:hypothetical protein
MASVSRVETSPALRVSSPVAVQLLALLPSLVSCLTCPVSLAQAMRKRMEILLEDRLHEHHHRPLAHCVLEAGGAYRPLLAPFLLDPYPLNRRRPIPMVAQPLMQVPKVLFQVSGPAAPALRPPPVPWSYGSDERLPAGSHGRSGATRCCPPSPESAVPDAPCSGVAWRGLVVPASPSLPGGPRDTGSPPCQSATPVPDQRYDETLRLPMACLGVVQFSLSCPDTVRRSSGFVSRVISQQGALERRERPLERRAS